VTQEAKKLLVDSNEPPDLIEQLVRRGRGKANFKVEQCQIRYYKCDHCGRVFLNTIDNCPNCDRVAQDAWETGRVADMCDSKGRCGWERKSESDYKNSVVSQRIYPQMENLEQCFGSAGGIVVEGYLESLCMDYPKLASWLKSVMAECQYQRYIHCNFVGDRDGLLDLVEWGMRKAGEPIKQRAVRDRRALDPRIRALMNNCDNVGFEAARTLYFLFGDQQGIIKAIQDGTVELLYGFGPKTLESLNEYFFEKADLDGWQPTKPLMKK